MKCAPCHSIGPGAKNKVGPEQNGLVGRKAGSVEGFNYSEAMKNSGITWDEATLDEYITDPKKKVPGNKMVFPGIKDELQRGDLIAYLASFNADGTQEVATRRLEVGFLKRRGPTVRGALPFRAAAARPRCRLPHRARARFSLRSPRPEQCP